MSSESLYLLTLNLPPDVINEINPVKSEYDPASFARLHAHLTLFPPFFLPDQDYGTLLSDLKELLEDQKEILLRTNSLSTFGGRVLFLDIFPSHQLSNLARDIRSLMLEEYEVTVRGKKWPSYRPHITIIQKGKPEYIARALVELRQRTWPESFWTDGVTFYTWQAGCWRGRDFMLLAG